MFTIQVTAKGLKRKHSDDEDSDNEDDNPEIIELGCSVGEEVQIRIKKIKRAKSNNEDEAVSGAVTTDNGEKDAAGQQKEEENSNDNNRACKNNWKNARIQEGETVVNTQLLTNMASMISDGGDAAPRAKNRISIFHQALRENVESVVDTLMNKGVSVLERDDKQYSALYHAVMSNNPSMISKILDKGVNIDEPQGGDSMPVLSYAIRHGHLNSVYFLLDQGSDVNMRYVADCGYEGCTSTPFYEAINTGIPSLVTRMIEKGANIDEFLGHKGRTPLQIAVDARSALIVDLLLDNGADVNKNRGGEVDCGPLYSAIEGSGGFDIAKTLLDHGAEMNVEPGTRDIILHHAAKYSELGGIVKLLMDRGIPVDIEDDRGRTPLFEAVTFRRNELAEALLESGACVNRTLSTGETPLHLAESADLIDLLVSRGANLNAKDSSGNTALLKRTLELRVSLVEPLLRAGSKTDEKNTNGQSFESFCSKLDKESYLYIEASKYIDMDKYEN